MNRDQLEGRANGKKSASDKGMKRKEKFERHGGKDGAVLGKINDDSRSKGK